MERRVHLHILGHADRDQAGHGRIARLLAGPLDHRHQGHRGADQAVFLAERNKPVLDPQRFEGPFVATVVRGQAALEIRDQPRTAEQAERLAFAACGDRKIDLECQRLLPCAPSQGEPAGSRGPKFRP